MQKGDDLAIMQQWQHAARMEPDERRRSDYGALALVFAELVDCWPAWKEALKEWNMKKSQQVLEWQAEGEARGEARGELQGLRVAVRTLLEDRFGQLSETLLRQIEGADSLERLQSALRQAYKVQSPDELKF
jgi:hypothetical protein